MTEELAVKLEKLSKQFILPEHNRQTLKARFINLFAGNPKTKQIALKGIDLEIKKGEFLGIVGRNGSGKSTLLKILAGIYQPTSGKVQVNGRLVPFIELGVGFNPELSGKENVYLNGAILGFSRKEINQQYNTIVEFAELEKFMDQKLKNYSSGMEVRLAFSSTIRAEADILLIDEVLAVGDADFKRKCYDYFTRLKKEKRTVIFVSHDMEAIRTYCDRAILLENGRIMADGQPEQVAQAYLKLFNNISVTKKSLQSKSDRWGNGWAKFEVVSVKTGPKQLQINTKLRARRSIESIVYGFRVKDSGGREITGSNSSLLGKSNLSLEKNQLVHLTWQLPNIFNEGKYQLDLAAILGDEVTPVDWWNAATEFEINKPNSPSYIVSPSINLEIDGKN